MAVTLVLAMSTARADDMANPLAATPLSTLAATRDRPLFSATRRAAPMVEPVAPVVAAPAAPLPVAAEPVPFVLVGTVTGEGRQIALAAHSGGGDVMALSPGDVRDGWTVRTVSARRAVLDKDGRSEEIALPEIVAQVAAAADEVQVASTVAPGPVVRANRAIAAAEPGQATAPFVMPIARVLTR